MDEYDLEDSILVSDGNSGSRKKNKNDQQRFDKAEELLPSSLLHIQTIQKQA